MSPKSKKKIKMTQEQLEQLSPTSHKKKKLLQGGSPTGLRADLRDEHILLKFPTRNDKKRGSVGVIEANSLIKPIPTEPDSATQSTTQVRSRQGRR